MQRQKVKERLRSFNLKVGDKIRTILSNAIYPYKDWTITEAFLEWINTDEKQHPSIGRIPDIDEDGIDHLISTTIYTDDSGRFNWGGKGYSHASGTYISSENIDPFDDMHLDHIDDIILIAK